MIYDVLVLQYYVIIKTKFRASMTAMMRRVSTPILFATALRTASLVGTKISAWLVDLFIIVVIVVAWLLLGCCWMFWHVDRLHWTVQRMASVFHLVQLSPALDLGAAVCRILAGVSGATRPLIKTSPRGRSFVSKVLNVSWRGRRK